MAQPHLLHLVGDPQRLQRVVPGRHARLHVAEAAAAGADVAEDHEGRRAALPALADVGAVGLLADGVQVVGADRRLEPAVGRARPGAGTFSHGGLRARRKGTVPSVSAAVPPGLARERVRGRARRLGGRSAASLMRRRAYGVESQAQPAGLGLDGLAVVDLAVAGGDGGGEAAEVLLGAELAAERGDLAALDPAGHDPLEGLQVVVDVDRQPVGGDPAADVDADRADLARLRRPRPRRALALARSRSAPRSSPPRPRARPAREIATRSSRRTYAWTSSP